MPQKLYVGGLSYSTTNETLHALFQSIGNVHEAVVIMDRDSGRSKGFGFVEMSSQDDATKAISQLNGKDFEGRKITVNEARERQPRSSNNRW